jgi:hypothetical protein
VSITDFINSNYNVVYKGAAVTDFDDVDEFLLADIHNSAGHSAMNSLFVNTFSKRTDAVCVEAIPSMQKIERDQALQSVWLATPSPIFGWDAGTIEEMMASPILQQIGNIEIEANILTRQILDPDFTGDKEALKAQLVEISIKTMSFTEQLMRQRAYILDRINITFPGRVKSMQETLMKAKEISSRTFLFAGETHLKNEHAKDSPFFLGGFLEFLAPRNVVVLVPKPERVLEMGQARASVTLEVSLLAIAAWMEKK